MAAIFQFKRATAARWWELNHVLLAGEPGYETDTKKFKIGDGSTPWHDLPYIGDGNEINAVNSITELPQTGNPTIIYKVSNEKTLYQWNATDSKYEPLTSGGDFDPSNIKLINGGKANV